jgi:hypothetical protein
LAQLFLQTLFIYSWDNHRRQDRFANSWVWASACQPCAVRSNDWEWRLLLPTAHFPHSLVPAPLFRYNCGVAQKRHKEGCQGRKRVCFLSRVHFAQHFWASSVCAVKSILVIRVCVSESCSLSWLSIQWQAVNNPSQLICPPGPHHQSRCTQPWHTFILGSTSMYIHHDDS